MPSFVVDFVKRIPTQWDDVKFIDGYPGKLVVLARRTGNRWIVVGLNGEAQEKKITIDLSFIKASKGNCIIDSAEQKVIQQEIVPGNNTSITLQPNGGFVIEF
jgi:alpha-glucosidase